MYDTKMIEMVKCHDEKNITHRGLKIAFGVFASRPSSEQTVRSHVCCAAEAAAAPPNTVGRSMALLRLASASKADAGCRQMRAAVTSRCLERRRLLLHLGVQGHSCSAAFVYLMIRRHDIVIWKVLDV